MLSTALSLVILLAAGGTAYAVSSYLNDFVAAYPAANNTRIDTCVLCHPSGAGARNAYGSDFGSAGLGNHTFNAALEARDSDGDGSTNLAEITTLTFPGDQNDPLPAAPTITTTSPLTAGTVGTAYNQTFAATGGTPPYSWAVTVGAPPAGLTLSAAGVLSGTPTTAGTSNFTVEVTGGASSTRAFVLTVNAVADNTPPTVTSKSPDNNATGVAVSTAVTGTFSEAIAPATLTAASFLLRAGVDNVTGTVSLNPAGTIATFTPSAPLLVNTTYTATLTTAITDVAGNALDANHVWTFTTAAVVPPVVTVSSDDGGGLFGCAISSTGGGNGGILGTYGPLVLLALGIAFRRRVQRRKE